MHIGDYEFREARYPTGIQSFEAIIKGKKLYVDKTALLYRLAATGSFYFLSRPRRFGKSLMLSTLKAYFQGRRELFDGLAISHLEKEWKQHPVIHLSMGGANFNSEDAMERHLNTIIDINESTLGIKIEGKSVMDRFLKLIMKAHEIHEEKVVILIDEYDKPMLDTRHRDNQLHSDIKSILRGFYGCIKESAEHIRFVMITGITKFAHVNIFSGLNNLRDISLLPAYNALCGISESEMAEYFPEDMEVFAEQNHITPQEAALEFKLHYDGYRFASEGENIYNPYSVMLAFANEQFGNYWFNSGTSKYLVEELTNYNYDFNNIENVEVSADELLAEPSVESAPTSLLYQSGYLTIKDYEYGLYKLGFPNKEVSSSFYNDLLKIIIPKGLGNFNALAIGRYAQKGEPEKIMDMLQLGLSRFNCMEIQKPEYEYHFKVMLHAILMAAGLDVEGEILTPAGRIDMVIRAKRFIYLFEFKIDSTPEAALQQIADKDYPFKYHGDSRTIFRIGASFSTETRHLSGWLIETD